MTNRPPIRVEMTSDPLYLSGARELVANVADRLGFNEAGCAQLALAVDEALCNVIRHGYERKKDAPIWVSIWPVNEPTLNGGPGRGPGIRIVIEDEAKQVDPHAIKGRDLDDIKPGGLGVHIIRETMDEAKWEKRDGKGMRLTIVKHISTVKTSSAAACVQSDPKSNVKTGG